MALGTAALVLGSGLSDGISKQLTDNLVAVQTGQLMLVRRDADFVRQNSPFDAYSSNLLLNTATLLREVESVAGELGIERVSPYLHARGTAIAGQRSSPAVILGIDTSREPEIFKALPPSRGTTPGTLQDGAYIGEPIARTLRLEPGDTVSVLIQTTEGAMNSVDLTVTGVFQKAAPWYDHTFVVPLVSAQRLVDSADGATNVKLRVRGSGRSIEAAKSALEAVVSRVSQGATVETAEVAGRFSFSIIQANETSLAILSMFLFAAAAVGIVNAMLMSVHERTREIGTIRALGVRRSGVIGLFVLEGLALGIVAAAIGVTVGSLLVLYWGQTGIRMNTITLAWLAGGDFLYPRLEFLSVLRAAAAIIGLSTLAAIYPARTASALEPREALHRI